MQSSICLVCKRRLKNSASIKHGMGPVCRAKRMLEENNKQGELFMVEAIPDFGDVICYRDYYGVRTNVPRRLTKHSQTGFEWGYGGSGPADLALNILSVFVGQELAEKLHQEFKWQFIANMPYEGGTIKREDILRWIDERKEAL